MTTVNATKDFWNVDTGWGSGDDRVDVGEKMKRESKITPSMQGLHSRGGRDDIFYMIGINNFPTAFT